MALLVFISSDMPINCFSHASRRSYLFFLLKVSIGAAVSAAVGPERSSRLGSRVTVMSSSMSSTELGDERWSYQVLRTNVSLRLTLSDSSNSLRCLLATITYTPV